MIQKIINNHKNLNVLYHKLDSVKEDFDFNNIDESFDKIYQNALQLKQALQEHFKFQEKLKNNINKEVDKLVLENLLVRDILLRLIQKIIEESNSKNIDMFVLFDDFYEVFKAYLSKEKGRFFQELKMVTTQDEQNKIKSLLL